MSSQSLITESDIERYRRLRAISLELNHRIIKTIPRKAVLETGNAIGVEHDGQLFFDSEDASSVLMDCCLYDWIEDDRNLVQRFAEAQMGALSADEDFLLQRYLRARYRVVRPQAVAPGAGVSGCDVLSGEQLFIMDVGLSRSRLDDRTYVATRTIPLDGCSMTGGAALPMDAESMETALRLLATERLLVEGVVTDHHKTALLIVRTCLEDGAAQQVRYDVPGAPPTQRSSCQPRRNEPCPCGSGRKYKKCCGRARASGDNS